MFDKFPKINYDMDSDGVRLAVTNIMKRFQIQKGLESKTIIFYDYLVKEGDRPDIVAQQFYGDWRLDWLVLITNSMLDPHFDWPKSYYDFRNFIIDKYGTQEIAKQTVHHYEWIIQAKTEFHNAATIPEQILIVDLETFTALAAEERKTIFDYDFEVNLNESRRSIKIIKKEFVPQITSELDRIFIR